MATERPHLNPGFKVVSQASPWRRTFSCDARPRRGTPRPPFPPPRVVPDSTARQRSALRAEARARRHGLDAPARIAAAEGLAARLRALPFMPRRGRVAGYWAVDGEIALHAWQVALPAAVEYCLPVLHADGALRFAPWRPGAALVPNRFGIPEPAVDGTRLLPAAAIDLVVVPLVAFDHRCHRLGMGGGWYDRSFADAARRRPPWLVGAAFDAQQLPRLPDAAWDVQLDAVCTGTATHLREHTR